jgi:hypothetical protein
MRRLALAAALAAAWLGAGRASAFCRPSTGCRTVNDSTAGLVCDPAEPHDCGIPLHWAQHCVSFDVQANASRYVPWGTADRLLHSAFETWLSAGCGGGTPSLRVSDLGPVVCDEAQYNHPAGNANILIFHDDAWPYDFGGGNTAITGHLALTTVTYDIETAEIYDADIEINTAEHPPENPGPGTIDLLALLTHETGHFLGLAHSADPTAVMYPSWKGIAMRALAPDDVAAICNAYPPDRAIDPLVEPCPDCCLPRHGWSPECASAQVLPAPARCGAAPGQRPGETGAAAAGLLVAALSLRRRAPGARSARRGS